jgi:hypothetical protein
MGFLWGLVLVGTLTWLAVSYLTDSGSRAQTNREFMAAPAKFTFALTTALAMAGFFLGIFIQPLGKIRIGIEGLALPLWQACGVIGAVCVVIHMFFEK